MSSPKVLVIGCGIAGPVIALLLQEKGYEPIVFEKVREIGDAGASLMMLPNGLKVLSKVGLADFVTNSAPKSMQMCDRASCGEDLGLSTLPSRFEEKYGFPGCGVKRTALNLALKQGLASARIPVHEGWKLKEVIHREDAVVAISEDGRTAEGSFMIGCDGIKAVSRSLVLKEHGIDQEEAEYTGLIQTAGISPTPASLVAHPGPLNVYGPGAHLICYPVSSTTTSWAITQRDLTEAQETWRMFSASERLQHRNQLSDQFKDWCSPVPELIEGVERLIKYGLYDRPQLEPEQWSSPKGRIVLIGDAAHPTSPHLGQGANQALEDCYHLGRLLPHFDTQKAISSKALFDIFNAFATLRQPRTAALVKGARAQGENRVISGGMEACLQRDERIRKLWDNVKAVEANCDSMFKQPF